MENLHTPKTPVPYAEEPHEPASPLTPLGWAILRGQDPANLFSGDEPALRTEDPPLPARPRWLLSLWLLGPFLVLDLLYGPVMFATEYMGYQWAQWNLPFLTICLGLLAAQASALLLEIAFSTDPWWRRVLAFAPLAVLYLSATLLGTAATLWWGEPYFYDEYYLNRIRYFVGLPLVALAGMAPLVTFRWVFGWALVRRNENGKDEAHVHRPASLVNMLLLIGAIAGGFGLIRLAPTSTMDEPGLMLVVTGAMSVAAGGISLFGVLPVIVVRYYVASRWLRVLGSIGVLALGIVASFVLQAALFTSWAEVIDNAAPNLAMFAGIGATYVAGLSLYLRVLRWWGWTVRPASRYQVG